MILDKQLYLKAHEAFFEDRFDKWPNEKVQHATYGWSERVNEHDWLLFNAMLVSGHLRELSNSINSWGYGIVDLQSWCLVLANFTDDEQWSLRAQSVVPIASFCLQQPYALREQFMDAVTQILHQANLKLRTGYKDSLPHDTAKGYLRAHEKLEALRTVGSGWHRYLDFEKSVLSMNDRAFTSRTKNYRNLANHGIAPNIEIGDGIAITRTIEQATNLVKRPDGAFDLLKHATDKCISYGLGGSTPLDLDEVISAVEAQHLIAMQTLNSLNNLIEELCMNLPKVMKEKND
jgi:hypothetical protein